MEPAVSATAYVLSLPERLRQAQLPPPSVRRRMRGAATLRDVGRELGVTAMTVQRWETGVMTPRLEHAIRYRALLDALSDVAS